MLLVLPCCNRDIHLVNDLIPWMRFLGPYPSHNLLLLFSPDVPAEAQTGIRAEFKTAGFASQRWARANLTPEEDGWPGGANGLFREACAVSAGLYQPWLFMEPDCTPMRRGWLDAIASEWNRDPDRPFLGVIEPTHVSLGGGEFMQVGRNMMGVGVYPADTDTYFSAGNFDGEPFDLFIANDIISHARHTNLIQNNWSTGRYRRDGAGRIQCDPHEKRVQRLAGEPVSRTVRDDAVLVHGCKDGSLVKLLMGENTPSGAPMKIELVAANAKTPARLSPEEAARILDELDPPKKEDSTISLAIPSSEVKTATRKRGRSMKHHRKILSK